MDKKARIDRFTSKPGEMTVSQCAECIHKRYGAFCSAFPSGIPLVILTNEHDHHRPYPGDGGVLFKQR